jgi:transcriptional regulator with XRE-family HTH domain
MLSLAPATVFRQRPPIMVDADDQSEQQLLGLAVAALRNRIVPRFSQEKAGEAFGTSGQGWAKYENGRAPSIFKPDVQRRLAEALGFNHAELLEEYERLKGDGHRSFSPVARPPRPDMHLVRPTAGLVVRETIQAGAWLDADDLGWAEQRRYAAAADPRFPAEAQYVALVRGDSMDQAGIFDGDFAHLVDITCDRIPAGQRQHRRGRARPLRRPTARVYS